MPLRPDGSTTLNIISDPCEVAGCCMEMHPPSKQCFNIFAGAIKAKKMRVVRRNFIKQEVEIPLALAGRNRAIFVSGVEAGSPCRAGGGSVC